MSNWNDRNRDGDRDRGYGSGYGSGYPPSSSQQSYQSSYKPSQYQNQQQSPYQGERPRRVEAMPGTKCYVGNISWNTDGNLLRDAFRACGSVQEAVVVLDRETGRSRGFGFVTFSDPSEAERAVQTMNGTQVDGRQIRVDIAQDRR